MHKQTTDRSPLTRRSALAAGALATVAPATLASCGSTGGSTQSGPASLTFMNQSRGQEKALTAVADKYAEENGIAITIESPGPADYLPKLQARAQSKNMPDIYSSFSATDMAPFYRAGWAMDFSAELDAGWKESFGPAVIEMSRFEEGNNFDVDPGVYTVHWETQTYGFLVNPEIAGFTEDSPPADDRELIEAFSSAPDPSRALSFGSSLVPQLLQGLASNWMSDEEIAATLAGGASWQEEGWKQSFQFLVDLRDAGVLANGALPGGQSDNADVEGQFFTGGLGAMFNASPGVAVGLATNPDFDSYFSIAVPRMASGTLEPRSAGVPGKGAVINPRGEHAEEALAFVKWLTEPEQQAHFAQEARILPTNPELLAEGDVPIQLAGFAAGVGSLQIMSETFAVDVKTAIVSESQRVVIGEATIDEALATIQAAQERTS